MAGSAEGKTVSNDLVKSVSIANLVNQRAAVVEKITAAVALIREASELATAANVGMPRIEISTGYGNRGAQVSNAYVGAKHDGTTWEYNASHQAEVTKMIRLGVDCAAWQYLMHESGMRTLMDATARAKWDKSISDGEIPELTDANIRATFGMLHDSRGEIFERGVIACFKKLSWQYKTNLPQKFGKRIVVTYLTSGNGHEKCNQLDDLIRVMSVLDGKPEPDHRQGVYSLVGYGSKVQKVENDWLIIKTFKNGNGHIEFKRLDLIDKMNLIIAKHYPGALPAPKS